MTDPSTVTLDRRADMVRTERPAWTVFGAAVLVSFAILAIGFRILYDSVIPEVAALALAGAVFGFVRPRDVWLSIIGIAIGIVLSQRVFPVTPSAAHIAQYGPPRRGGIVDFLMLCAIPAVPALLAALVRVVIDRPARSARLRTSGTAR